MKFGAGQQKKLEGPREKMLSCVYVGREKTKDAQEGRGNERRQKQAGGGGKGDRYVQGMGTHLSTSPGCIPIWLMTAFLPTSFSTSAMNSLSVMVLQLPRLYTEWSRGVSMAAHTPCTMSDTNV